MIKLLLILFVADFTLLFFIAGRIFAEVMVEVNRMEMKHVYKG